MSEVTMTDIETIRDALVELSVRGFEATANDALRTLSRIERVVEAAREFWPQFEHDFKAHLYDERAQVVPFWHKANALREALGALGG